MVFSFFRRGRDGADGPPTITPPKPVLPKKLDADGAAGPFTQAPPEPVVEEIDDASWDDLLYDSSAATAESHSAVEEAAILYANERVTEAIATLEHFLKDNGASRDLQPWLLLFDLYQSQDMKRQFDERSMEFVVRFERSPPAWEGPLQPLAVAPTKPAKAGRSVVLKEMIAANAEDDIQKLLKLAEGEAPVRLDLSKVTGIDSSRAHLLAEVLLMIRKSGKRLVLIGGKECVGILQNVLAGEGRSEKSYWRLLFEMHQFQNAQAGFEDAAVDYAVTFEVSPPSWEPMPEGTVADEELPMEDAETEQPVLDADSFLLDGVISAAAESRLRELKRYAENRSEVTVDMSQAIRVDFEAVGTLIAVLGALGASGKKVIVSGTNEMIYALFELMGVKEFATLMRRKAR